MAEPKSHRLKHARIDNLLSQALWSVNSELSCIRRRPNRAREYRSLRLATVEVSELATRGAVLRSETLGKGFTHSGVEAQKEKGFTYD